MRNVILIPFILAILSTAAVAESATVDFPVTGGMKRLAYEFISHSQKADSQKVTLRLMFDDGNIMEVSGTAGDAKDYISGKITEYDYINQIEYMPLTRGPVLIPGLCQPSNGENCNKNPECACQNMQTCKPGASNADEKGCMDKNPPKNAHKDGSEYICDDDLTWNQDMTGCTPRPKCTSSQTELEGKCYDKSASDVSDLCCFLTGFGMLTLPVLAIVGILVTAAVGYFFFKQRKK